MADYRTIMSLLLASRSYRQIGEMLGCSQRDVARARKVITEHGITADSLAQLPQSRIGELFPDRRRRASGDYEAPEFAAVVASMRSNPHFTLLQGWRTYLGAQSDRRKYGYSQYCHLFSDYAAKNDLVATLHHEPGRAVFIDWAGDTLPIVDAITGEVTKAYLFVAVLPYSGYLYCRGFTDMRMGSWLEGHIGAFDFFGGVPQIVVPDHASTATHRGAKGDAARVINPKYQQMADHYGTAIVPARIRRPRDKAAVESAVQTINKRVIGYLAEEVWMSIAELNEAIGERVDEINHQIVRADHTTRYERFAAEEAEALATLPVEGFEEVEWKQVKVGRNYHVTCDSQHYSVPHRLAGQLLRARLTQTQVVVFAAEEIVAEHRRRQGRRGQYSTDPAHVPDQHKDVAGLWSRDWFTRRAGSFGPATVEMITQILDRNQIEAQGYLECQNILETLGRKNKQRLEAAAAQMLNLGGYASYSGLKRLVAAIDSDAKTSRPRRAAASTAKPSDAAAAENSGVYVRGADYYQQQGR
ncbi:IS21 family transposase [Nesterenkonia salmonea]|uniref:IS21 family transposase n=1 Tax=Nesterenkonia salmonea TaxID=1804987 RepID=A0A5R9B2P8_9MICC|nr:IS21 family transposase [Nesterenkonia salmonea]TLP90507.1 IS21 family transposase [Nesterenkonia salmonea]